MGLFPLLTIFMQQFILHNIAIIPDQKILYLLLFFYLFHFHNFLDLFQPFVLIFIVSGACMFSILFIRIELAQLAPLAQLAKAGMPCSSGVGGMGLILANSDAAAQNVPCFRRWRFKIPVHEIFSTSKKCQINSQARILMTFQLFRLQGRVVGRKS